MMLKGGRFSIYPADEWDSASRYEAETNVLTTLFRTRTGLAKITDFMAVPAGEEAESVDDALDVAGRTFLNAGGVKIDTVRKRVSLSKIFKWYGDDFRDTTDDLLKFIAPYLYDGKEREFLEGNLDKGNIGIEHQDYDWRLNRY